MKQLLPCFAALLCLSSSFAQKADMKLFSAKDINFIKPRLIGQAGSHYLVYDESMGWPSAIYSFDSAYQLANMTRQYINDRRVNFRISGNHVYLVWKNQTGDSASLSASAIDEQGNERWFNHHKYYFPGSVAASPPSLVTDVNNRYFAFYSLITDSAHKDYMRIVMFDTAWRELKSGFYPVFYDRKTTTVTPLMVDSRGDMHFATYDKLGSYRISSVLTMFTIPLYGSGSDSLLTRAVGFEKMKFFDLAFLDDTIHERVKLAGYYYDGQDKTKQGVALIRFPYKRNEEPASQLYPFPASLSNDLRSSLVYLKKRQQPVENMRIKDVFEKDGKLVISNWLVDMPRYLMVMDKDVDKEVPEKSRRKNTTSDNQPVGMSNSVDGWLQNSVNFNRSSSGPLVIDPRNPGVLVGPNYVPVFTSPIGGTFPPPPSSSGSLFSDLTPDPEFIRQLQNRNAGKLVYFSIDEAGNYQNQIVPYTSPNSYMARPGLNNFPVFVNGQLLFLNDVIKEAGSGKNSTLVKKVEFTRYNYKGQSGVISSFNIDPLAVFTNPSFVAPGKYLGVYQNKKSGENGIAVWQVAGVVK